MKIYIWFFTLGFEGNDFSCKFFAIRFSRNEVNLCHGPFSNFLKFFILFLEPSLAPFFSQNTMQNSSFLIVFDKELKKRFLEGWNFGDKYFFKVFSKFEYNIGFIEKDFLEGWRYFCEGRIGIQIVEWGYFVIKVINLNSVVENSNFGG
jgi:hypothetical protein